MALAKAYHDRISEPIRRGLTLRRVRAETHHEPARRRRCDLLMRADRTDRVGCSMNPERHVDRLMRTYLAHRVGLMRRICSVHRIDQPTRIYPFREVDRWMTIDSMGPVDWPKRICPVLHCGRLIKIYPTRPVELMMAY